MSVHLGPGPASGRTATRHRPRHLDLAGTVPALAVLITDDMTGERIDLVLIDPGTEDLDAELVAAGWARAGPDWLAGYGWPVTAHTTDDDDDEDTEDTPT